MVLWGSLLGLRLARFHVHNAKKGNQSRNKMSANVPHNLMHRSQHLKRTTANRAKHLALTTVVS